MAWARLDPTYVPAEIDTTVPSVARVYDAILGGKDNISQVVPAMPVQRPDIEHTSTSHKLFECWPNCCTGTVLYQYGCYVRFFGR